MAAPPPAFFEAVCVALAPRCGGEVRTVRALGSPFGDGTFERWVGAGLLTTDEAAALLALAAAGVYERARIDEVLGGQTNRGEGNWGWGFEGRDEKTAADAKVRRSVPSSRRPLPPRDEESDSWGWGADESSAIFESLISEHVTALDAQTRFRLDAPHARNRIVDIYKTRDLLMGRDAAAHVLRPDAPLGPAAFIRMVRQLASLQHPQIQPVYELDRSPDGVPFFVTAEPLDATLAQVFKQIAQDETAAREEWPLAARLEVLLDVSRAVAFAHRAGVAHRDLRPSKVRLGAFGETVVTGWFRARRRTEEPDTALDSALALVNGGLGYLAPERLENGLGAAGIPADVWGLGSLLYGCLTRRPPFAGSSKEVSQAIREGKVVPPDQRGSGVPPALSTLCMQALEIEPGRRRISADEFVAEVEDYLDGTRTEERRLEQAEERLEDAEQTASRFFTARARLNDAWDREAAPRGAAEEIEADDALSRRVVVDGVLADAEKAFYDADDAFVRALSVMPGFDPARYGLCRLYFRALQDAERGRLRVPAHVLRANIRQLDPGGFTDALAASARLEVRTRPAGAEVRFHQYRSRGGVQTPDRGRVVGTTPLAFEEVRPGDYVMVLAGGDGRSYVLPVHLAPGEHLSISMRLPSTVPQGCVFVPAGPARVGMDGEGGALADALPGGRVDLRGFVIARDPVTLGAYGEFLDDLWRQDPAQAADHAPRSFEGTPPLWTPGPEGYALPFVGTDGKPWGPTHPAVGLRPADVEAYVAWRSARDGVKWRLPTDLEWEKAARSAEGRAYPWGDRPEPAFCHHLCSDAQAPHLMPVGAIEADRSVYGVRDLAGGVREYVGELDAPGLRGGSWMLPFSECLLAARSTLARTAPLTAHGFRLAIDGPDGPQHTAPAVVPEADWVVPDPLRIGGGSAEDGLASAELTVAGRSILMNAAVPKPPDEEDLAALDDLDTGPDRYTLMDEIARGSMGKVMLAYDRVLKRHVALKLLHDKHRGDKLSRYRFVMEARITGRLQHPTMVPVYDMGVLRTGQRFFSMKVIEGQSLQDVLRARSAGDRRTLTDYNRDRLLTVMRRVCQGVAFAHERRIVHRDLKPANILLGDFGEVCVVDLGLARCIEPDPSDMADVEEARELAQADGRVTRVGSVIGTPYYMSPEQAMGLQDLVDDRSDIYGLGAILYHVLAHRPPFSGRKVNEVLAKVRRGNPRPPSLAAPDQGIAAALDEIVLQTLSMDPADRYESALDLADALALYQARARMEEKSREAARQRAARAQRTFQAVEKEQGRLDQMRARVHALGTEEGGGRDPVERRRRVVHQQEKIRLQEDQIEAHLTLAVRQLRLALDAGPIPLRDRLVTMLKTRCLRAERMRDPGATAFYVHLLRQIDDDEALTRWLDRGAPLTVHTRPPDMAVVVQRTVTRQRRLEPGSTLQQGRSPITLPDVPVGSGLCTFTLSRVSMRVPYVVVRDRPVEVDLEWPDRVYPGFVCIPGGRFLYGGDPLVDEGQSARSARIGTYHIGIHPVTCGEYNEWLESLVETPDQRAARIPIMGRDGLPMWGAEGQILFGHYDPKRPVTGITLADAHAFAQWRSRRDGVRYRLPTSAEWEKAARGVDGRAWPWGDDFEPSCCRPETPGLHPVGRFPHDVSPYGVRDIVTGVTEWTLTAARDDPNACYVRGGCSALPLHGQPCTARTTRDPRTPSPYIGFRLVIAQR